MRAIGVLAGLFLITAATGAEAQERLVMQPYPAATPWKMITDKAGAAGSIQEWIPADQTVDAIKDILSRQTFVELKGKITPTAFLSGMFTRIGGRCDGPRVNGPVARVEGDHAVAYGQTYCGKAKGQTFGVDTFYKVIQGDDALYVVLREMNVPPSEAGGTLSFPKERAGEAMALMGAVKQANDYLSRSVYLCGGSSADTRCLGKP